MSEDDAVSSEDIEIVTLLVVDSLSGLDIESVDADDDDTTVAGCDTVDVLVLDII